MLGVAVRSANGVRVYLTGQMMLGGVETKAQCRRWIFPTVMRLSAQLGSDRRRSAGRITPGMEQKGSVLVRQIERWVSAVIVNSV